MVTYLPKEDVDSEPTHYIKRSNILYGFDVGYYTWWQGSHLLNSKWFGNNKSGVKYVAAFGFLENFCVVRSCRIFVSIHQWSKLFMSEEIRHSSTWACAKWPWSQKNEEERWWMPNIRVFREGIFQDYHYSMRCRIQGIPNSRIQHGVRFLRRSSYV